MTSETSDSNSLARGSDRLDATGGQRLDQAIAALGMSLLIFDKTSNLQAISGEVFSALPSIAVGLSAERLQKLAGFAGFCELLNNARHGESPLLQHFSDAQGRQLLARFQRLAGPETEVVVCFTAAPDAEPTARGSAEILKSCIDTMQKFETVPPPHKLYVLVVDDDEDSRYITVNNLQASNACQYALAVATSVEKALALMQQNEFDVCVTDYRLRGETAIELHEQAQSLALPPPFIVVTNYPEDTLYAKLLNRGITDLITKSEVTPEVLSRSIRYAVQKSRLLRGLKAQLSG